MATNQTEKITDFKKIGELENSSGLTNTTVPNLKFLNNGDWNLYAARLDILVNGKKAIGHKWDLDASPYPMYEITSNNGNTSGTYGDFIQFLIDNHMLDACKRLTPAGKSGQLVDGGMLGINTVSTSHMPLNPMTGPAQNTPSLVGNLLNSVDPNMVTNIENICNIIRTRSYFSLPPSAFGSLQTLLYKAQGAVQGFVQALYNIYHGVILLMQRFAIMVNGLLSALGRFVYDFINTIIPLDLICAILGAFQSLLDDVAFFAQLFGGGDSIFNAINSIQVVINYAAEALSYAYNPIALLNLIPGVGNMMGQFNQLLSDPEAFMGNLITHFGLGNASNNKALQIANAILLHYGLEGQLGPLGPILLQAGVAGNSSQWFRTGNLGTGNFGVPQNNFYFYPNVGYFNPDNPLEFLDVNSNPYFNQVSTNLADFTNNLSDIPGAFTNFVTNPLG
jgi:hypothetical protein